MENVLINAVWAAALTMLSINTTKMILTYIEAYKKEQDEERRN